MDINALQQVAIEALEDIKGEDIVAINTEAVSPMFERIIVATGQSTRQVKSLAHNAAEKLRAAGLRPIGIEGESSSEWVLVDCGAIVVHVMLPELRDYYRLEDIWQTQVEHDARFKSQYQAHQAGRDQEVEES